MSLRTISLLIVFFLALSAVFFWEGFSRQGGAELKKFGSLDEMKGFLRANQGEGGSGYFAESAAIRTAGAPLAASAEKAARGTQDYSRTNIQVEGVDEADIVKSDGKYIYIAGQDSVTIVDAYPGENARIVSSIALNGTAQELFVRGDKLIVFGYENFDFGTEPLKEPGARSLPSPAVVYPDYYSRYSQKFFIKVFDVSDRANPELKRDVKLDGSYYDSRMIDNYVYVIVTHPVYYADDIVPLPMVYEAGRASPLFGYDDVYYFDYPDYSYQFTDIIALNADNDEEKISSNPYMTGYAQSLYVSAANIYLTGQKQVRFFDILVRDAIMPVLPAETAAKISVIQESNLSAAEKLQRMSDVLNLYQNTLTDEQKKDVQARMEKKTAEIYESIEKERQKTIIHKIGISSGKVEYKSRGEVPGTPLNQFSMDEHNGHFRIATTTTNFGGFGIARTAVAVEDVAVARVAEAEPAIAEEPSPAEQPSPTIVVLEPSPTPPPPEQPRSLNHMYVLDSNMKVVGKLEDLAPNERIYSVRFMGDRAYMVTFRQVDPLFVIDLKEPASPKVLGKLKIPGVSDYLHPYDENHIIGVGKEAVEAKGQDFAWFQGVKISLFDVSDVEHPIEKAKYVVGHRGTDSEALRDHKAFLFDRGKNLLVLPVLLAEINEQQYPQGVPDSAYGGYTFQGAYVFELTKEKGFVLVGRITHVKDDSLDKSGYYYFSPYAVKRSLYIGDYLYTLSDAMLKASSLADLKDVKEIELPFSEKPYFGYI